MKTLHVLAAKAIAIAYSSSMAQVLKGWYVQGDLGQGHASVDCSGTDSCNRNGFAVGVTGGYVIGSGFSAELGYMSYGTASATSQGATAHIRAQALKVGGAYSLPFADTWYADFRLGAANVKTSVGAGYQGLSAVDHDTSIKPYLGLGAGLSVAKDLKVHAGIEWTKAEIYGSESNVRAVTAGVRYDF